MKKLNDLVKVFRKETDNILKDSNTSGICYLLAHCLNDYFIKLGYESRKVSGKQALLRKSKNIKYVSYGNFNKRNYNTIGDYHSWCEIVIDEVSYVIDVSLGYNKSYMKRNKNISLSNQIPNFIVTATPNTFYYKFVEDDSLSYLSEDTLSVIDPMLINRLIETPLAMAKQLL
jgi:hypothetical protein